MLKHRTSECKYTNISVLKKLLVTAPAADVGTATIRPHRLAVGELLKAA